MRAGKITEEERADQYVRGHYAGVVVQTLSVVCGACGSQITFYPETIDTVARIAAKKHLPERLEKLEWTKSASDLWFCPDCSRERAEAMERLKL